VRFLQPELQHRPAASQSFRCLTLHPSRRDRDPKSMPANTRAIAPFSDRSAQSSASLDSRRRRLLGLSPMSFIYVGHRCSEGRSEVPPSDLVRPPVGRQRCQSGLCRTRSSRWFGQSICGVRARRRQQTNAPGMTARGVVPSAGIFFPASETTASVSVAAPKQWKREVLTPPCVSNALTCLLPRHSFCLLSKTPTLRRGKFSGV